MALRLAGESLLAIQGADNQGWVREIIAQDALPGLKIDQQGTGRVFDFQDGGASKMYLPDGGNVTVAGSLVFDLANDVTITPSNPAAPRTLTIPAVEGNRTFAFLEEAQTFTARPTLNAGLRLGDEVADPAAAGQFGLNGTHAKVYSGGAVHNLSNVFPGLKLGGKNSTEAGTSSTTAVDILTVSGLSIPTTTPILITFQFRKSSGAIATAQCGIKANAAQVLANTVMMPSNNAIINGICWFLIGDKSGNYSRSGIGQSANGGWTSQNAILNSGADRPAATIISITITGLVGDGAIMVYVDQLMVHTLPTA